MEGEPVDPSARADDTHLQVSRRRSRSRGYGGGPRKESAHNDLVTSSLRAMGRGICHPIRGGATAPSEGRGVRPARSFSRTHRPVEFSDVGLRLRSRPIGRSGLFAPGVQTVPLVSPVLAHVERCAIRKRDAESLAASPRAGPQNSSNATLAGMSVATKRARRSPTFCQVFGVLRGGRRPHSVAATTGGVQTKRGLWPMPSRLPLGGADPASRRSLI